MGLIIGGLSPQDLILDGQSVSLYVGGNPPIKVWPTRETVQITLGAGFAARDQFRAALTARGLDYATVTEVPFDIELVGSGEAVHLFRGCSSLTTIPPLDTSQVTNMNGMFQECHALTTIPPLDTSNVVRAPSMFAYCNSLTSVPDLDASKMVDVSYMFTGCSALTDGNVRLIGKHPSVTTTGMINNSGLTREPFYDTAGNPIDVVQITGTSGMTSRSQLRDAVAARGLDYRTITHLPFEMDTSQATSLLDLFNGWAALVAAPEMDTSQVIDMGGLFRGCTALEYVGDLQTSNVTNAGYMFDACPALTDGNVRLIGRNPNVTTTNMISGSGLTREPWYKADGTPDDRPRVVTIRRSSVIGEWDRASATGDTALIQGWVGNDVVRFVAAVTCDQNVYSSDSHVSQSPGTVLRVGAGIKPAGVPTVYTFTEVI